jgi:hypothetical protein
MNIKCGDIVWCTKIHEDELNSVPNAQQISRQKRDGTEEKINRYTVTGKSRPALVLRAHVDIPTVIVWYTHSTPSRDCRYEEVTGSISQKDGDFRQTFLRHDAENIRRVPQKPAWLGARIGSLDKTVFDGKLRDASKLGFLRI